MEPCALRQEKSCEKCCSSIRYHISCHSAFNPIIIYYTLFNFTVWSQCLKITEKVAFKIASEASYVYILNGQKLTKNAKIGPSILARCDILSNFQTLCVWYCSNNNESNFSFTLEINKKKVEQILLGSKLQSQRSRIQFMVLWSNKNGSSSLVFL